MQKYLLLPLMGLAAASAVAQDYSDPSEKKVKLSGSIQTDWLLPENDESIGATKSDYRGDLLGNTYVNLNLDSKWVNAGLRLEYMDNPLPGFENEFDTEPFHGKGVPYFQVTASNHKWIEGTLGTFYEQFGSGFILRAYEERNLGVDNSILGARLLLTPYKGVRFKALGGIQRYHFSWNDDTPVFGADLEVNLDQWFKKLNDSEHFLMLGVSGVIKQEGDATTGKTMAMGNIIQHYNLQYPERVGAIDLRLQWQHHNWNVIAEYALKNNDPQNNAIRLSDGQQASYIYHNGSAAMLSASYSRSGFSALVQAKRSENMGFRSRRDLNPTVSSLYINHQPAFAFQHTYSLAALYPYATQMDGEWAFQGDLSYRFKRKTPLGGKYGTLLKLNASHIRGLKLDPVAPGPLGNLVGTDGYKTSFFSMTDEVYYQDINLTLEKKLSKEWKLTAMYMYQKYNQEIIEGHTNGNYNIVESHIFVADAKYQATDNLAIRMEGQYLVTEQDKGDWAYATLEVSFQPHWMISIADQYNTKAHGGTDTHFYSGALTYNVGSHRIALGYGRTREGLNCNGGVCRKVPAQRGATLSWNYNF